MTGTVNPSSLTAVTSVTVAQFGNLTLGGGGPGISQVNASSVSTSGTVNVLNRGTLSISGAFVQTGGTVASTGGAITASSITNQAGLLEATGIINGNVTIGNGVGAQATLSAGPAVGSLDVNGDLGLKSDGRLLVHFRANSTGASFDSIDVSGMFTPGGVLDISIISGTPTHGTTYSFLNAGSLPPDPQFADVVGLPSGNGSWVPHFNLTNGIDISFTSLKGDMNGDFAVDEADVPLFAWALRDANTYHFQYVLGGGAAFATMADMDLDGEGTYADIPLFLDLVGGGGGNVQAAAATMWVILAGVPEPSTALMLIAASAWAIGDHRRRHARSPTQ